MPETKAKYTKDSLMGDVIKSDPRAEAIIKKYFGNGCFTCPGVKMDSISFGAMMHGLDPNIILKELNEID